MTFRDVIAPSKRLLLMPYPAKTEGNKQNIEERPSSNRQYIWIYLL